VPTIDSNDQTCHIPFKFNSVENYFCIESNKQGKKIQCITGSDKNERLSDCFLGILMIFENLNNPSFDFSTFELNYNSRSILGV
jgi:hypothetical protein